MSRINPTSIESIQEKQKQPDSPKIEEYYSWEALEDLKFCFKSTTSSL
jgi:hypothetical protein